ncbi:MAG: indole-3-glycerol phosphate synthase TrpC [Balneolaceae bacterium]|nr:MAG: indole-3-glycerol phosphate synthase TrpC [Balneolaceae bacterium]
MDILEKIVRQTKDDLSKRKREVTLRELESFVHYENEVRSFSKALIKEHDVSIIAEVKKASPSKGIIREDFDPLMISEQYIEGGASAISVLTDEPFFKGSLNYLKNIRDISPIPLLRKDFIVEPYQIKEARAFGADAILLIVSMYEGSQLSELIAAANEFGLEALVECYTEEEFLDLNWDEVKIAGVNNRNLSTFEVDLHRGVGILSKAPEGVVRVSESGIHKPEDMAELWKNGIHSALIGEHFMRQPEIGKSLKEFIEKSRERMDTNN